MADGKSGINDRPRVGAAHSYWEKNKFHNKLPDLLKKESNDKIFSKKLKHLLLNKYYYSIRGFLKEII